MNKKANFIEIFNEFCILLATHEANVLLDESIPLKMKSLIGWTMIGTAMFNVLVNLSLTMVESCIGVVSNWKVKNTLKHVQKAMDAKLKNRRYLAKEYKGAFEGFDSELAVHEAILFNKKWLP